MTDHANRTPNLLHLHQALRVGGRSALVLSLILAGVCCQAVAIEPCPIMEDVELLEGASLNELRTLENAISLAEQYNPGLRAAAAAVERQRGLAIQAGLYPNPDVVAGPNQLGNVESQYSVQVAQEFVTKGKLRLDRAAAREAISRADAAYVQRRFELLTTVRKHYYEALAAKRRVEIIEDLTEVAWRSVRAAQQREKGGEGTTTDTLLLTIEAEQNDVAELKAIAQYDARKNELVAVIGLPEIAISTLEGDLATPLPAFDYALSRQQVVNENAQVQASAAEVRRSRILLRRAVVEPFPNVTVEAGYQYFVGGPNNQALLVFGVPLPVWDRNQGNVRAARAEIAQAVDDLGQVQVELANALATAIGNYQAATQAVDHIKRLIQPKAQRVLNITQTAYEQGQLDFLRLLEAEKTLIEVNLSLVDANERRWTAAAEVAGLLQLEVFP
ncbi:Cobalt-zinc-cadmium resistance protein CzcC precursor [Planctomycetes bacterium Pan216]|uniref:Cobalt-zinc-cadmium resistance protein CzcC n=1 Tax=Kolteria novifilia TaxID=2527975 RepID=A0A518B0A7_9BACT|nr:Cobalt-zinc-cadmium resistance protein CzcC precursor [Planctomycetes bacterium Pan216]